MKRYDLTDNKYRSTGIYLQPTRSIQCCVYQSDSPPRELLSARGYTNVRIPEGEMAVSIKGEKYLVWLAVEAVDSLAADLEQYSPTNEFEDYINRSYVICRRTKANSCPVCGDDFDFREKTIIFADPNKGIDGSVGTVAIHIDCISEFVEIIESVWEYPEALLSERV